MELINTKTTGTETVETFAYFQENCILVFTRDTGEEDPHCDYSFSYLTFKDPDNKVWDPKADGVEATELFYGDPRLEDGEIDVVATSAKHPEVSDATYDKVAHDIYELLNPENKILLFRMTADMNEEYQGEEQEAKSYLLRTFANAQIRKLNN